MRTSNEIRVVDAAPRDQLNQQKRDFDSYTLQSLNVRTRKNQTVGPYAENNAYLLSGERHVLGTEVNGTRYDGVPGCIIDKDVTTFTVDTTTCQGMDFRGQVSIAATASVVFTNCRFSNTVAMTAGARAHFVGCYFYEQGSVNNSGVAANAYIVGCVRKSGIANVNVTTIAETT